MAYQDIADKRRLQAEQSTSQKRDEALLSALKQNQLATYLGTQTHKPSVVLTDQTDLGDKIKDLTGKLTVAVHSIDTTDLNKQQVAALLKLGDDIDSLETAINKASETQVTAINKQTAVLVTTLTKMNLSPQITVPEPRVTVNESAVDFKPLEKAIKGLKVTKAVSLSDYKAHDLNDAPDGSQYVGFIAMDGSWYIIHADDETNSMRYCFGNGNYQQAWGDKYSHEYKILSEAIHGLSA